MDEGATPSLEKSDRDKLKDLEPLISAKLDEASMASISDQSKLSGIIEELKQLRTQEKALLESIINPGAK